MSVIISGMEMPKNCKECRFCYLPSRGAHYHCYLIRGAGVPTRKIDVIRPLCPLIPLPSEHGRLIDADFEEAHYASMTINPTPDVTEQDKRNSLIIIRALKMAKTIVPAERGGEFANELNTGVTE